jgi:hypothetical protein
MDLDVVVLDDFADLIDEHTAPFVGWSPALPKNIWNKEQYSGSMFLFTPGDPVVTKIWTEFDINTSPHVAMDSGFVGSDQAWMTYILGGGYPVWRARDGIVWYRTHAEDELPDDARVVFFTGDRAPWHEEQQQETWIKENWRY